MLTAEEVHVTVDGEMDGNGSKANGAAGQEEISSGTTRNPSTSDPSDRTSGRKTTESRVSWNYSNKPTSGPKISRQSLSKQEYKSSEIMAEKYSEVKGKDAPAALKLFKEKGVIADQTAANYLTDSVNVNPYAVEQMGLDVLVQFRRKVFAMVCAQAVFVWLVSFCLSLVPAIESLEWYIGLAFFGVAVIFLALCTFFRYKSPANVILLLIFSIFISIGMAIVFGRNILHGLLCVAIGIAITSAFGCLRIKDRGMFEMTPVTVCVAFFMAVCATVYWVVILHDTHWSYWLLLVVLNSFSLIWFGHIMDRLSVRLSPDEYMLPFILTWAELIPAMLFCAICIVSPCIGDDVSCDMCCETCGSDSTYYWAYLHCDCYICNDGSHSWNRNKPKREDISDIENAAPEPAESVIGAPEQQQVAPEQQQVDEFYSA